MTNAGTSETTSSPSTTYQPYKLMRARKGRMLAGVAAGLAKSSGLDVTVVRVCVGLSMLSGLGWIAYLLLWIVLPEEQPLHGRVIEEAPENTAHVIRVSLFVAAILGALNRVGVFWPFSSAHAHTDLGFDGILGLILLSVGVGVLFSRHRPDRSWWEAPSPPTSTVPTATTPAAAGDDASFDTAVDDVDDIDYDEDDADPATYVGPLRFVTVPVHNAVSEALHKSRTADVDDLDDTTGAITYDREPGGAALGWARVFGWFTLLWWSVGVLGIVALWRYGALSVKTPVVLALVTWLAFTAVLNALLRVRQPAAIIATLGFLIAPITIGAFLTRAEGPIGARTLRPTAAAQVGRVYEQSVGSLTLDFSDTHFRTTKTTEIDAKVGAGALFITVPNNVGVVVDSNIRTGGYNILGKQTNAGIGQSETLRFEGCEGAPKLHFKLRGGAGWMELKRANGNENATCPAAA